MQRQYDFWSLEFQKENFNPVGFGLSGGALLIWGRTLRRPLRYYIWVGAIVTYFTTVYLNSPDPYEPI